MESPSSNSSSSNGSNAKFTRYRVSRAPLLLSRGKRYIPLFKNVLVASGLMMIGEACAEELKHCLSCKRDRKNREKLSKDKNAAAQQSASTSGEISILCDCWRSKSFAWTHINVYEVLRLGVFGAFQGTYQHFYYTWLDKKLVGISLGVIAKKVILDEIAIGPASLFLFFLYNGTCYTGSLQGGFKHMCNLFWPAYVADLATWPIVQTINFAIVPSKWRVPYVAFFMCLWNSYLCLLNFKKGNSKVIPVEDPDMKKA